MPSNAAPAPAPAKFIEIKVRVPEDRIANYVERAVFSWWGEVISWNGDKLRLVVKDEDGRRWVIDSQHWPAALEKMAETLPHHFRDLIADKGDSYTGQILIQLAAFGEIRYE